MEDLQVVYSNLTFDDVCSVIKEKQLSMATNFVEIGFFLRAAKDQELYLDGGYSNIYDMALDKFGMARQTTNHAINVNKKFSQGGYSPILEEQYREYGKSQLQEMLYLTDTQLESVHPDMTIKEIRGIKKAQEEPKIELKKPDNNQCRYLEAFALHFIKAKHDWMREDFQNRVQDVTRSPEEIRVMLGANSRMWYFSVNDEQGTAHINLFNDYVQIWDENGNCMGDFEWFYLAREIQASWNVWATEKAKEQQESERKSSMLSGKEMGKEPLQADDAPKEKLNWRELCDKGQCPPNASHCERQEWGSRPEQRAAGKKECEKCWKAWSKYEALYANTLEEVQEDELKDDDLTIEGQQEPAKEQDELKKDAGQETEYTPRYFLEEQKEKLDTLLWTLKDKKLSTSDKKYLERQKIIVGALANMVTELEETEEAKEMEQEQPELPILKNNEQRKQWLREYKDWGLWYEDKHIGVKYYRYTFENGASLVAEVYERSFESNQGEEIFETAYFHLIGGPKPPRGQHGEGKWTYNERYSRWANTDTELIEFLKELQRK